MFSGSFRPFALDGAGERGRDVEVQGVAEFVSPRSAAGLDAGGQVARVMASEAGFAQRSHQIAQRLESEKVQALVGDFKFGLLCLAGLPANARLLRRIVRLVDADVIFLLHALDQLLDQFVQRAIHLHLAKPLAHFLVQKISLQQCLFDGAAQIVQRLLAVEHVVEHVVLEAALQQVVRERAEQVLHAHLAGRVGNVFAVADAFHKKRQSSLSPFVIGSSATCLTACFNQRLTTDDRRLVIRSAAPKWQFFTLERLFSRFRLFLPGGEDALLVAADALVRVQAFQNKFSR